MNKLITNETVSNFIQIRQLDQYMIGHKGYIAGGVFKNIFNNEKVKDIDIFFESEKDYLEAKKHYDEGDKYIFRYENDKVVAYLNTKNNVTIELIRHKYKKPLDMVNEFDFTVTKFVYYKEEVADPLGEDGETEIRWRIAYHEKFFEHLHMKRLVIDNEVQEIILPVNTFNRMFRYARYGYFPCRETKAKIIQAMRELPEFSDELLGMELYNGLD